MHINEGGLDVEDGCEGAVNAMISWLDAIEKEDFDRLELLLDDRFTMTCNPIAAGGRFDKKRFIELDRHVRDSNYGIVGLTARRCEDVVVTQLFAKVQERFEGDLGPGMPSIEELASYLSATPVAYASLWREGDEGQWLCLQHHVFGPIGQYRP